MASSTGCRHPSSHKAPAFCSSLPQNARHHGRGSRPPVRRSHIPTKSIRECPARLDCCNDIAQTPSRQGKPGVGQSQRKVLRCPSSKSSRHLSRCDPICTNRRTLWRPRNHAVQRHRLHPPTKRQTCSIVSKSMRCRSGWRGHEAHVVAHRRRKWNQRWDTSLQGLSQPARERNFIHRGGGTIHQRYRNTHQGKHGWNPEVCFAEENASDENFLRIRILQDPKRAVVSGVSEYRKGHQVLRVLSFDHVERRYESVKGAITHQEEAPEPRRSIPSMLDAWSIC